MSTLSPQPKQNVPPAGVFATIVLSPCVFIDWDDAPKLCVASGQIESSWVWRVFCINDNGTFLFCCLFSCQQNFVGMFENFHKRVQCVQQILQKTHHWGFDCLLAI